MNRAAEIEASMANIAYELEHDIYNPPVLKDNKPFNMSDYIKPVKVTDEDYEVEKVAYEEEEKEDVDTDDLLKEYNMLANEMLQDEDLENEENIEQLAEDNCDRDDDEDDKIEDLAKALKFKSKQKKKSCKKQATYLLGNAFMKESKEIDYSAMEKVAYYKELIKHRVDRMR